MGLQTRNVESHTVSANDMLDKDHLMFDEDPGSVKEGEAHWVMSYMRAWRPTFIYVSVLPPIQIPSGRLT